MMLTRRLPNKGPSPQPGCVSRAQFHTAVESYQNLRQPANRLVKPLLTSADYSYYENTSRRGRRSNDVTFPPVYRGPVRSDGTPRRHGKRGPRTLPRMRGKGDGSPRLAWCNEDGSVNLQALAELGAHRQSFPRSQSYYDRLHKVPTNKSWPQPSSRQKDESLIPLLLNDDELTPRKRAERDSFLKTLLQVDDLTEEELEEIAQYFIPDDPEVDSSPPSSSRRKSSPRSAKGGARKKTTTKSKADRAISPKQSPGSKSVRFSQSAPLPGVSENSAAEEASQNQNGVGRRPSDPFHVASPRSFGSSDDVAYIQDVESPPEIPASPRVTQEPKVTYYDDDGEEIEEDIVSERIEAEQERVKRDHSNGLSTPHSKQASSQSERVLSPVSEANATPEHLPDLDTPRLSREPEPSQTSPRSKSSTENSPRLKGMSDDLDSSRGSSPSSSPAPTTQEESVSKPLGREADGSMVNKSESSTATESQQKEASPRPSAEQCPNEYTSSKKSHKSSRPKSAKREGKSSSSRQSTMEEDAASTKGTAGSGQITKQSEEISQDSVVAASHNSTRADKERETETPLQIPVISLTRGQLPAVPSHKSLPTQAADATQKQKSKSEASESPIVGETSSSIVSGVESASSVSDVSEENSGRRKRKKDYRMKIWLTKTAWDRHVEMSND